MLKNIGVAGVCELIGTFIFLSVIAVSSKLPPESAPIAIVIGLLVAIYLFGDLTGGNFNPAVTIMQLVDKKNTDMNYVRAIVYILFQIVGGVLALLFINLMYSQNMIKQQSASAPKA
jgi:glycerol uptake facilitator-like aquaporin